MGLSFANEERMGLCDVARAPLLAPCIVLLHIANQRENLENQWPPVVGMPRNTLKES